MSKGMEANSVNERWRLMHGRANAMVFGAVLEIIYTFFAGAAGASIEYLGVLGRAVKSLKYFKMYLITQPGF